MTKGVAALTLAALIAGVAVLGILAGCGRRPGPSTTPQTPAAAASQTADLESQTVVQQEKRRAGGPAEDASEQAAGEGRPQESEKSVKPKLTDEQYIDLMVELAVITSRLAQEKMDEKQFVPELEKVCKKYGVTLDDLEKEKDAHQLSEEQNSQFTRRLAEELKASAGGKQ